MKYIYDDLTTYDLKTIIRWYKLEMPDLLVMTLFSKIGDMYMVPPHVDLTDEQLTLNVGLPI